MTKEQIKRLPFAVKAYQKIYPSNSTCGICGLPWSACTPKTVELDEIGGCFATCEYCWERATQEDVMKAHTDAYVAICLSLFEPDMQKFIGKRPLEHVLECVCKEYDKTHNL